MDIADIVLGSPDRCRPARVAMGIQANLMATPPPPRPPENRGATSPIPLPPEDRGKPPVKPRFSSVLRRNGKWWP